jgi:hypothetical protein
MSLTIIDTLIKLRLHDYTLVYMFVRWSVVIYRGEMKQMPPVWQNRLSRHKLINIFSVNLSHYSYDPLPIN